MAGEVLVETKTYPGIESWVVAPVDTTLVTPEEKQPDVMSRRDFLKLVGGITGALVISRCTVKAPNQDLELMENAIQKEDYLGFINLSIHNLPDPQYRVSQELISKVRKEDWNLILDKNFIYNDSYNNLNEDEKEKVRNEVTLSFISEILLKMGKSSFQPFREAAYDISENLHTSDDIPTRQGAIRLIPVSFKKQFEDERDRIKTALASTGTRVTPGSDSWYFDIYINSDYFDPASTLTLYQTDIASYFIHELGHVEFANQIFGDYFFVSGESSLPRDLIVNYNSLLNLSEAYSYWRDASVFKAFFEIYPPNNYSVLVQQQLYADLISLKESIKNNPPGEEFEYAIWQTEEWVRVVSDIIR